MNRCGSLADYSHAADAFGLACIAYRDPKELRAFYAPIKYPKRLWELQRRPQVQGVAMVLWPCGAYRVRDEGSKWLLDLQTKYVRGSPTWVVHKALTGKL
jgi:hypothetical protein